MAGARSTPAEDRKEVYTPNRQNPPLLSTQHRRQLEEESGISAEIVAERGYRTVRSRVNLADFKKYQRRSGLLIPVRSPSGATGRRLRPHTPRKDKKGKIIKYEQPEGTPNMLDVHPRNVAGLGDAGVDLWVTEGEKKADALASRGLCAVALFGVWGWCVKDTHGRELLPCWDHVALKGRKVYVVFDADIVEKENVQLALERLVAALEARGADVQVVYLPGPEKGVDDYLVAGHAVNELKMLARTFEPEDLERIRLSRDEKLRAAYEDLERRFWEFEWKGVGGYSARDVALKLIEAALRHGKVVADGIRVEKAQGPLALDAKVSSRTLWKALNRLEERGFLYRDNAGRTGRESGAFVLRANVSHYGGKRGRRGAVTQELQRYDPYDLHLRPPRLRWSQPKFTPKRGTVAGTRMVRQGPKPEPRPAIKRLGKIRGAILDILESAGGALPLAELYARLHPDKSPPDRTRWRPRDLRRRNLPMLEEAGIVTVDGEIVALSDNWLEALEEQRRLGKEIEAEEVAYTRYKAKSEAYREWLELPPEERKALKEQRARARADGFIGDLRPAGDPEQEHQPGPKLSPLAVKIREYLDTNGGDASQPPGWIGTTLWAFDLWPGKPTPAEVREAIEELGGDGYLRALLERARETA